MAAPSPAVRDVGGACSDVYPYRCTPEMCISADDDAFLYSNKTGRQSADPSTSAAGSARGKGLVMPNRWIKRLQRGIAGALLVAFVVPGASACELGSVAGKQVGRDISKVGGAGAGLGGGGYAACKAKGTC
jgi:hypothetical protein